uniref:Uncharacterized protein n=1 Tax=Chromera velia CCMP2878 TaxID=1169474 RepID=A0A0G4H6E0_9ALVE|eukprot:Cvel_24880.t1-p1 / transcript=Cvel_24880.t1 / gene=Cvel_24880 / organism=Chromera_velia_CCMP2878 / gene_product=hypothetical protein / transcript_product=hypothetical protein / location=Cvel_scaffold2749:24001-24954(+) / protein_length=318 / sequence_SO=supercontig / SO=protein_coding / is_pseudo=false
MSFLQSEGAEDVEESLWEGCEREVRFRQAVSPRLPFMPATTGIEQTHRGCVLSVLPSSDGNSVCVMEAAEAPEGRGRRVLFLEVLAEAFDVPFAETFLVLQQWALWEGGEEPCAGLMGLSSALSAVLWKGTRLCGGLERVKEIGNLKGVFSESSFLVVEGAVLLHKHSVLQASILKRGLDASATALRKWKHWASAPISALADRRSLQSDAPPSPLQCVGGCLRRPEGAVVWLCGSSIKESSININWFSHASKEEHCRTTWFGRASIEQGHIDEQWFDADADGEWFDCASFEWEEANDEETWFDCGSFAEQHGIQVRDS